MPQRYQDRGAIGTRMTQLPQKTKRTHEENQERAYIAASRRTDRSIEARVKSAHMASKIHKRRTGKALRVSEEIVMGDDMYEEEEQRFSRSCPLLEPYKRTSSAELNMRAVAYLTNRTALSNMENSWHENEVNRAFAEIFPNHQDFLNRRSSSGLPRPPPTQSDGLYIPRDSPSEPSFQPIKRGYELETGAQRHPLIETSPPVLDADGDYTSPPPLTLTPESESRPGTPYSSEESVCEAIPPLGSLNCYNYDTPSFTAALAIGVKEEMVDAIQENGVDPAMYCHPWISSHASPNSFNEMHQHIRMNEEQNVHGDGMDSAPWEMFTRFGSTVNDLDWDTFINDAA